MLLVYTVVQALQELFSIIFLCVHLSLCYKDGMVVETKEGRAFLLRHIHFQRELARENDVPNNRATEKGRSHWQKYKGTISSWRKRNFEKRHAVRMVEMAIRNGKLIRPSSCSSCSKICRPHGHHHLGYDEENLLNVVWLCHACHLKQHGKKERK